MLECVLLGVCFASGWCSGFGGHHRPAFGSIGRRRNK
jgi:hypothetical protein